LHQILALQRAWDQNGSKKGKSSKPPPKRPSGGHRRNTNALSNAEAFNIAKADALQGLGLPKQSGEDEQQTPFHVVMVLGQAHVTIRYPKSSERLSRMAEVSLPVPLLLSELISFKCHPSCCLV